MKKDVHVLVTGGTGFLGKHFVKRLLELNENNQDLQYHVTFIGRNQTLGHLLTSKQKDEQIPHKGYLYGSQFIAMDLADRKNQQRLNALCDGVHYIFHCAALCKGWGTYDEFYQSNLTTTEMLLEGALHNKNTSNILKCFVFVSTPSIYTTLHHQYEIKEDETEIPSLKNQINYYSQTKLEAENLIHRYHKNHTIPFIIIRPRAIYGNDDTTLLPRIVEKIEKGKAMRIGSDWDKFKVDITHVENVVEALLCCMDSDPSVVISKTYNITDGEPVLFWDLITMIAKDIVGKKDFQPARDTKYVPFWFAYSMATALEWVYSWMGWYSTEPPVSRYVVLLSSTGTTYDISKAKKELGYKPRIRRDAGLAAVLKHHGQLRQNLNPISKL